MPVPICSVFTAASVMYAEKMIKHLGATALAVVINLWQPESAIFSHRQIVWSVETFHSTAQGPIWRLGCELIL